VVRFPDVNAVAQPLGLFALTVLAIGAVWWWLGAPIQLPPSPLAPGEKFYCVSYAPFRDGQDPMVEGTHGSPEQIEQDLALLAKYTDCVRTYAVDDGGEAVLESARRHGLKVLHGVWVSSNTRKTRHEIDATIALAAKYPDVIRAIVVGNEVLLRGEMSAANLMAVIREVKAKVSMPVTYADVWEFWLRYPDVQNAVDFLTIHILPYWEDFPIPARFAAAHVDAIRRQVAAAIPGKPILIGEFGWPAAGRMREGARPSPSNQARVIEETLALAKRENYQVNVIEAFDQSWKRALEGAAGGYWGIFSRAGNGPRFTFGGKVSNHPRWPILTLAGIGIALLTFAAAWRASGGKTPHRWFWPAVMALCLPSAILFGWTLETVPVESFSFGTWLRSLAYLAAAGAAPVVCGAALAVGRPRPSFAEVLARAGAPRDWLGYSLGAVFMLLVLMTVQAALGLVFDPRYRDMPFAPLTAAVVPFLVLWATTPRPDGERAAAEMLAAAVFAVCAVYVALNESFADWQAVWFSAALLVLSFILARARDARG